MEERIIENTMDTSIHAVTEKRTYTVSEIQDMLGIGRNAAYNLIKSGCFKTVKVGHNIHISKKSFDEWLDTAV